MEGPSPAGEDATTPEAAFTALRPLLFSVAYRLLGRPADAEDAVQESWLRFARAPAEVRDPRSWLIQVVTRLCLDQLRSARERHEQPSGIWLPEPVLTGESVAEDPLDTVERRDLLSLGALAMLQRLSPSERAALVLHEAIGLSHGEVAQVLGVSDAGSRQLLARARRRVAADPARQPAPSPAMHRRLVAALRAAFDSGDTGQLVGLLRDDAVLVPDTGGELAAPPSPLVGRATILHYLAGWAALRWYTAADVEVNGEPGILFHAGGEPAYLVTFVVDAEGRVQLALNVGGPTKLAYTKRQGLRLPA
ncbi:MAG: sigma-70 family RNA polymerase sigma factor [Candidatus Dormibacteraeota bacterium]|nr:sigma-70 family RNA polymerase sigma factor [Candidatus Dormibacteraeota bacterium]MBO0762410.1 sigma-70 family RNA polymerase sigma factor [Candidatus Dormibacteraeota bacterium]